MSDLRTYEKLATPHLSRLRAFARRRLPNPADADDISDRIQDIRLLLDKQR